MAERTKVERLKSGVELLVADPAGTTRRRFRVLAYTGVELTRGWGRMVIDLQGIEGPAKLPTLLDHQDEEIVGFCDKREMTPQGLVLEGLLSKATDAAQLVGDLADEGYPWTASIGIERLSSEDVAAGAEATVNGQAVKGPIEIWRRSNLFELSFASNRPADKNTVAQVLRAQEEEGTMKPDEFLKANPAAVEAWRQEGATAMRAQLMANLGELVKEFPERLSFAIERFTVGKSKLEIQAEEGGLLREENAKLRATAATGTSSPPAPATGTPPAPTGLDKLKAQSGHPGVGFAGNERQGDEDLTALPIEERAKLEFGRDPQVRLAFHNEATYAAFLRAEARGLVDPETVTRAAAALRKRSAVQA